MINGIIKLFYSEIVKSNMKKMPNEEYSLRDECRGISNIAIKIDNIFGNIFKLLFALIAIFISLNINVLLGVGVTLTIILITIYKIHIQSKVKDSVDNIKNNIEHSSQKVVTMDIKSKIYSLVAILSIGVFSDFNFIIVACFVIVFMFTIKDIYSNINK